MRLFKETNIPFIPLKRVFVGVSVAMIIISVFSLLLRGGPNWGIDFKGGSLVQVQFNSEPDLAKLRSLFDARPELGGVEIKRFGEKKDNEIIIGIQKQDAVGSVTRTVNEILAKTYGDQFTVRREEEVGPRIGNELKWKAALSLSLSLLAIIAYLWFRFELIWGLAAVIALFHDVFIVLGAFCLVDREVSLPIIAAFLTIIGYSVNDTIVVFDRIRENMVLDKTSALGDIINRSINQTLSRTIITNLTVFLAVLTLYLVGVSVIKDLAFAFTVGAIVGTYSSISVAGAILASSPERWVRYRKRV